MGHRSAPPNPILDVFQDLRLTQSRYLTSTLSPPWGLRIPDCGRAMFHFVAQGACVLRVGATTKTLDEGDFVLLPHGAEHDLAHDVASDVQVVSSMESSQVSELSWSLSNRGGHEHPRVMVISGSFLFEPHPAVAELPTSLFVRRTRTNAIDPTARVVACLMDEVATARPGSAAVVNRLADVLVIGAIRSWLATATSADRGWFAALHDDGLGRALALIHTNTRRPWTLEELATEAGMSRASFAKRFAEVIGTPPIQFLTRRRMQLATRWLRDDSLSISEVTARLGYSSEAAFSRAFKRCTGDTPGTVARDTNAVSADSLRGSLVAIERVDPDPGMRDRRTRSRR